MGRRGGSGEGEEGEMEIRCFHERENDEREVTLDGLLKMR